MGRPQRSAGCIPVPPHRAAACAPPTSLCLQRNIKHAKVTAEREHVCKPLVHVHGLAGHVNSLAGSLRLHLTGPVAPCASCVVVAKSPSGEILV